MEYISAEPTYFDTFNPPKAKQMILLGEQVSAEKCLIWGLAEEVVPNGSAMGASVAVVKKILEKPPIPVAMTKQAVNNVTSAFDRAGIYMDADQFLLTTFTKEHEKGVARFWTKDMLTYDDNDV